MAPRSLEVVVAGVGVHVLEEVEWGIHALEVEAVMEVEVEHFVKEAEVKAEVEHLAKEKHCVKEVVVEMEVIGIHMFVAVMEVEHLVRKVVVAGAVEEMVYHIL